MAAHAAGASAATQRLAWAAAAGLAACYANTIQLTLAQLWRDEDTSYALSAPLVIFWIVWRERARWSVLPVEPSWWGVALLAGAACVHLGSVMGAGLFAGAVAFVLSVAGAVLGIGGWAFLRAWTFPWLLTLFMLPKLAIVYYQATLPLQLLASRLAEAVLLAGRAHVTRDGNILDVGGRRIEVAAACSGIRYILPLAFVAVVFGYFSQARPWMRVALLAAAVPAAIFANAIRIAAVACVPALDAEALHAFAGCVFFLPCLAALVMLRRVLHTAWTRYHV